MEIFPAMLDAIEGARDSIEFETFIYWSGDVAERMARGLAEAARRGVQVRVLLDAAGCAPMDKDLRHSMDEAGVRIRDFGPLHPHRFWELDHRTHRKILVCDGTVGFTGGVGIAVEWEGDARSPEEWRESHFQLEGPAVQGLRATFLEHWLSVNGGAENTDFGPLLPHPLAPSPGREGGAEIQVISSAATGRWSDVQTLFRVLVRGARERIRLTTAYFVPEPGLVELMAAAAERGVEVDVLHPGEHIDHRVSQLAGEAVYPQLLAAGVRIWRYQPTMLHAKVMVVDDLLSCIGSANLNHRSAVKDDEVALLVLDEALAHTLIADFEEDMAASEGVTSEQDWYRRSRWRRLAARLASLVRWEV